MRIYMDKLTLPGALPGPESPQPVFCAPRRDMAVPQDGTLRPAELTGYGAACGARCLPYRMQDRYARSDAPVTVETAVLENDRLKAVFLPGLGGRLWSLYSKAEGRELLFRNPALRIANLAIRGAWFSGGIEWNLGHTGHHVFTCAPLYCCRVTAPDGEQFLRMYQYEAIEGQVLQLDFHLPDGAAQLAVQVRIENTRPGESPLYWWTNTAMPLTGGTRVFSGTAEVLYQLTPSPENLQPGFGICRMPFQPNLPGVDVSFPARIPHSVEYFFQNGRTDLAPWEVCAEPDGRGLFERSTQPLFARKMFCWGIGQGGRHWCDYLAQPGQGDYIEIQAGLAPSQLHTARIAGRGVVQFVQLFGAFTAPAAAVAGEWNEALPGVEAAVESLLPAARVNALAALYAEKALLPGGELLCAGDERGGLERLRRQAAGQPDFAPHLAFPAPRAGSELAPWAAVLAGEMLPETERPLPYMTDPAWLPFLEELAARPGAAGQAKFQCAVALAENGRESEALPFFEQLVRQGSPWAAHALGLLLARQEEWQLAADAFVLAHRLEGDRLDPSFAEQALNAPVRAGRLQEAWQLWQALPPRHQTETGRLTAAQAAVALGQDAFVEDCFTREYACIREGALGLANVWFEHQARLACRQKGVPFTPAAVDYSLPLPRELDFRMFGA